MPSSDRCRFRRLLGRGLEGDYRVSDLFKLLRKVALTVANQLFLVEQDHHLARCSLRARTEIGTLSIGRDPGVFSAAESAVPRFVEAGSKAIASAELGNFGPDSKVRHQPK